MTRANIDVERLREHFRTMARIRAFEEAAEAGQKSGEIRGAVHLSVGQEAVASGICANLRRSDYLVSTHRGHGHTIAKGADVTAMMAELLGKAGGTCQGKGGSMHIADFSIGMLGANGVVGAGIPIAAGAAHAVKLRGGSEIVACFFGDGAVNRGPFLEGLNWARIYDLPILFICEDNGFAATTRTRSLTGGPGPAARAEALGIPARIVDGNAVEEVDAAAAERVTRIREGGGPQFILAQTYRLKGHTAHDPATYRPAAEVEEKQRRDPIELCRETLLLRGVPAAALAADEAAARVEIAAAVAAARAQPWGDESLAWRDVQDMGAPA
ncbi:MAG TPA: thiamine pyrophosphate-dependent dehydrogenase E1 component subunit alpha [Stellaceae bacterium]|nr:thiamine pyrophosphate-dependent dehydrogenase E1 component subunit alpha [Stellaceae bacterium]